MHNIIPIRGKIQQYQWGGTAFLPELLHYPNENRAPQAEYWLGVHPSAPAQILANGENLNTYLNSHQLHLNFLLKILDVQHMLSIQVHPNSLQAQNGFERENASGIPLSAKERNYKDANPKPELMLALSEFWLLHGFMPLAKIMAELDHHSFLQPLRDYLSHHGIRKAFTCVLDSNDPITQYAASGLKTYLENSSAFTDKAKIDYWLQRWHQSHPNVNQGILALYFLNLVKLNPGDAIYQPAGLLHAYLEGQNIELMANSDNVLRAGLTPKHIDVNELLNIACFDPSHPQDFEATPRHTDEGDIEYTTPFEEFALTQIQARTLNTFSWTTQDAEILLCTQGSGAIACKSDTFSFEQGQAFFIAPSSHIDMNFNSIDGVIVRAKNLPTSSAAY